MLNWQMGFSQIPHRVASHFPPAIDAAPLVFVVRGKVPEPAWEKPEQMCEAGHGICGPHRAVVPIKAV